MQPHNTISAPRRHGNALDLVDDKARWKRGDATSRHGDSLATYRTAERPDHGRATRATGRSAHLRVDDMLEAALADGVRAGE